MDIESSALLDKDAVRGAFPLVYYLHKQTRYLFVHPNASCDCEGLCIPCEDQEVAQLLHRWSLGCPATAAVVKTTDTLYLPHIAPFELWKRTGFLHGDVEFVQDGETIVSISLPLQQCRRAKRRTFSLQQCLSCNTQVPTAAPAVSKNSRPFVKELFGNYDRRQYQALSRRELDELGTVHYGQRKLLLGEMEFLCEMGCINQGMLVLYAGAAPGIHILILAQLFPKCLFVLYDTAPFEIPPTGNIVLYNSLFDSSCIDAWGQDCLLISDIRSTPPEGKSGDSDSTTAFEECVLHDMSLQNEWVQHPLCKAALCKFRIPHNLEQLKFSQGRLMTQCWARQTSTECRLIVRQCVDKIWDQKQHEEQMFFFNTVDRTARWQKLHPYFGRSWDTYREYGILCGWIDRYRGVAKAPRDVLARDKLAYALSCGFDAALGNRVNTESV